MPMKRGQGQRAGLSREAVLDAAMTLVDREGLEALTMRRLAAQLGVEAMTIYHHVPNKAALLDGLVERLLTAAAAPLFEDASWKTALRELAHSWLAALRAHPNLMPAVLSRPAVTPATLRVMDRVMERLARAGFPHERGLAILYSVAGYATGQAVSGTADPDGPDQTGVLGAVDLAAYPTLARALRAGSARPADRFDYGLDAMLRGFEADLDSP
jgi:AcrR family transcriptional regulator